MFLSLKLSFNKFEKMNVCYFVMCKKVHGTTPGSKLGKEYIKAVYCHTAYLIICRVYIMRNAGLDKAQAAINQDCWEKYQKPQIHRRHNPYGRKQRRTKEPLDESERGVEKLA